MSVCRSSLLCHDLPQPSSGVEILRRPWGSRLPPANEVLAGFFGQSRVCSQLVLIVCILRQKGILVRSELASKYADSIVEQGDMGMCQNSQQKKANMTCEYDECCLASACIQMCFGWHETHHNSEMKGKC